MAKAVIKAVRKRPPKVDLKVEFTNTPPAWEDIPEYVQRHLARQVLDLYDKWRLEQKKKAAEAAGN